MTNKSVQTFDIRFPVAFGSGLAAALLCLAASKQSAFAALLLFSLAPLPIMIATLGFGHMTGLGAAVSSAVAITALLAAAATTGFSLKVLAGAGVDGLVFALGLSLPAWWLAQLAGSGESDVLLPWMHRVTGIEKPADSAESALKLPSASTLRYPFGDILLSIAVIAFLVVTAMILIWVGRHGSYRTALATAAAHIEPMIVDMIGPRDLPKNLDLMTLAKLVIEVMPAVGASIITLALAANLWLAGRVVELSHRLIFPWPDIPHDLRVPRIAALLFALCCGLSFLDGLPGAIARAAAAALGMLFVLQGLAVVHDLTRGMRFRTSLLCGLYLAIGFLMPWPLVIFAGIGLVEAGFGLRDRKAAALPNS